MYPFSPGPLPIQAAPYHWTEFHVLNNRSSLVVHFKYSSVYRRLFFKRPTQLSLRTMRLGGEQTPLGEAAVRSERWRGGSGGGKNCRKGILVEEASLWSLALPPILANSQRQGGGGGWCAGRERGMKEGAGHTDGISATHLDFIPGASLPSAEDLQSWWGAFFRGSDVSSWKEHSGHLGARTAGGAVSPVSSGWDQGHSRRVRNRSGQIRDPSSRQSWRACPRSQSTRPWRPWSALGTPGGLKPLAQHRLQKLLRIWDLLL